jgi:acetyl-CoA carboxylase carboxyltransferase component
MKFESIINEHERRTAKAQAMGGPAKLKRRKEEGWLNARERVACLFDPGTWRESGLFATSNIPEMADATPADGKVTGFGHVEGRPVGVVAYDFTVKGSSSSFSNSRKMTHIKEVAKKRGFPVVFMGESTGVRMPDVMGGRGMGMISDETRFLRAREAPWVSGIFGNAYGSAAWHACASDFNVMRKGGVMAVSSSSLVRMATGQNVDPEDLGGWEVHARVTGFADAVASTDEDAIELMRRFLGYLPSNSALPPPRLASDGLEPDIDELIDIVPESPNQVYDVRKVINGIIDRGSFFELKALFAPNATTGLARIDGRSVGIIANNPRFKVGALDANACDKVTSFIVLCDSFNIPIIFLVDQPGFLVSAEAERQGIAGKVVNWMNAISLCTVPRLTILMRKSYGQAYINMGAGGLGDEIAAWWTADISFMNPSSAAKIVFDVDKDSDPVAYEQRLAEMARENDAYSLAAVYGAQEVIDPRDSRAFLCSMLDVHEQRNRGGVSQHLLATWPSSFR